MLRKHSSLSGFIVGLLVLLLIWFFSTDLKEMMTHVLSSVLTLCLIASTIFLANRKRKINTDSSNTGD